MVRICIMPLVLLLAVFATAQAPVPGTFSTAPVQPNNGLVLTAPMMSLGNGISPTIVTNQQSVVVESPGAATGAITPTPAEEAAAERTFGAMPRASVGGGESFYAGPSSGMSLEVGSDSRSLGEVAASLRHQQPANERVYTNDDVERLDAAAQAPEPAQQGSQQQPPAERPHQYSVPVGSAPPSGVVPNEQAPKLEGRPVHNPFAPKVREVAPAQERGGEQQIAVAGFPKTASMLPLLGVIGGALFAAGLIYRSLRD